MLVGASPKLLFGKLFIRLECAECNVNLFDPSNCLRARLIRK
jgi:hypothetical protein